MRLPIFLTVAVAAVVHRAPIGMREHLAALETQLQTEAIRATADAPTSSAVRCPDVLDVDAERVATGWPGMTGQRVRLSMRIERTVDFTLAIGASGKHRFAVVISPDATWTGTASRVFVVTGARAVQTGGRLVLPELMLDDGGCDG